jgi:hypothetical protein
MAGLTLTNCSCDIYTVATSYNGVKTETLEQSVDGWLEEGDVLKFGRTPDSAQVMASVIGSATLFLWDDVDVRDRVIKIDDVSYDVILRSRFLDPDDNSFHHLEITLQ